MPAAGSSRRVLLYEESLLSGRKKKLLAMPAAAASGPAELRSSDLYVNRELSLLAFQHRVLEEARDPSNPLLERVKFLSIVGSNLGLVW